MYQAAGPDPGERFRSLNFLDIVVRTSRRARIPLAAKPETDTFGHEPALVARTCSPAKLLGSLKFVGTPRLSLLALLGVMTLGGVIHVLQGAPAA
jgi:hypothetical protein